LSTKSIVLTLSLNKIFFHDFVATPCVSDSRHHFFSASGLDFSPSLGLSGVASSWGVQGVVTRGCGEESASNANFFVHTLRCAGLHEDRMNDMASPPNDGEASRPAKLDPPARTADEVFDPFGLGDTSMNAMDLYLEDKPDDAADDGSSTRSPKPPPQLTRLAAVKKKDSPPKNKRISSPLPPRIVVKLGIHEEVSSMAKGGPNDEGASEVSVEGTLYVSLGA